MKSKEWFKKIIMEFISAVLVTIGGVLLIKVLVFLGYKSVDIVNYKGIEISTPIGIFFLWSYLIYCSFSRFMDIETQES